MSAILAMLSLPLVLLIAAEFLLLPISTLAASYAEVMVEDGMSFMVTIGHYDRISSRGPNREPGVIDQQQCESACSSISACRGYGIGTDSDGAFGCRLYTILPCQQHPLSVNKETDLTYFFKNEDEYPKISGSYELHSNTVFEKGSSIIAELQISYSTMWLSSSGGSDQIPKSAEECMALCDDAEGNLSQECKAFSFSTSGNPVGSSTSCSLFGSTIYNSNSKLRAMQWHISHQSGESHVSGTKLKYVNLPAACMHNGGIR